VLRVRELSILAASYASSAGAELKALTISWRCQQILHQRRVRAPCIQFTFQINVTKKKSKRLMHESNLAIFFSFLKRSHQISLLRFALFNHLHWVKCLSHESEVRLKPSNGGESFALPKKQLLLCVILISLKNIKV